MNAETQELLAFRRTGEMPRSALADVSQLSLCPALFAPYRNVSKLRHDYPLVLVSGAAANASLRSLSSIVDEMLREIAPEGPEGERLRKHVLRLETEIRTLVFGGAEGTLHHLWYAAETHLLPAGENGSVVPLRESLRRARAALRIDGTIIGCESGTPVAVVEHAWRVVQREKSDAFLAKTSRLILKLSEVLAADFMKSDEARSASYLKGTVGTAYESSLDFDVLSRVLTRTSPKVRLPEQRKRRISAALAVLESQRFFAPEPSHPGDESCDEAHPFVFQSCGGALKAFRERLPEMLELIKAVAIAELEIANRYRASAHDPVFDRLDQSALTSKDWAIFPSYLICLRAGHRLIAEDTKLIEALTSGLPMKVLAASDDILDDSEPVAGRPSFGGKSVQLASMVVGLNDAYVLQVSASHLCRMRQQLMTGLTVEGPALFSVFSGSNGRASNFPPYLASAAAMQSRAFPTFTYDPSAGSDLASRCHVSDNPAVEFDWPISEFQYQDEELQRVSVDIAFTLVDFVAADRRYASHFARIPRSEWNGPLVPLKEYLAFAPEDVADRVPYILMVDQNDRLHRVAVDDTLVDGARRCAQRWHTLQELGGVHNSHANRLLAKERAIWDQEKSREIEDLRRQLARPSEAPPSAPEAAADAPQSEDAGGAQAAALAAAEEPPARDPDEPFIETPRCTTCDECTDINNRMFRYDENKQAYLADLSAGTYRELVEAAENCKVAIIHPGKPKNPDEPGLDELIERAKPF